MADMVTNGPAEATDVQKSDLFGSLKGLIQVVDQLRAWGGATPDELVGREENIVFSMPKELR